MARTVPTDGLADVRRKALERWEAAGLPSRKTKGWRHTSVKPIVEGQFSQGARHGALRPEDLPHVDTSACRLVFVNGRLDTENSRLGDCTGLHVQTLGAAISEDARALAGIVARPLPSPNLPFSDLNTALMEEGAVITVAAGVRVPLPVHVIWAVTGAPIPIERHVRIVLHAGRGSEVTLAECWLGTPGAIYFHNAVTDVVAEEGARVRHVRVQREAISSFHLADLRAQVGEGASLASWSFAFGAELSRVGAYVRLARGATCDLRGLSLARGTQHADHTTVVVHAEPEASSTQLFKGILDEKATAVYSGLVEVAPGAVRTVSHQSNRNLLLSDTAHADSEPQLEIHCDDVICQHGSAIGSIEEESLFYLRSRGLDERAARGLLTQGFAHEVIDSLPDAALREAVAARVAAWLGLAPEGGRKA